MAELTTGFPGLALVGFGEAGHAFAAGWSRPEGWQPVAYDLKLGDPENAGPMRQRCVAAGVRAAEDRAAALSGAGLVFSVVTADQALEAARACAPFLEHGAFWLDCNSCAPQTKQRAAALIEAAGGRYVDVAVMAPVHPKRHEVPLLLAGPHAAEAASLIVRLGMRPSVSGDRIGDASSIKMLRSVMIKGLEALTTECLLAARRAGVEDAVIASLQASDPGFDWRARGAYNLERMMVHGERRAAEVEEVCVTLRDLGLPDWMSRGTVEWQRRIGSLGVSPGPDDLASRSDALLDRL